MTGAIKSAVATGHGQALISVALIAAAIGDALPTPADALYFRVEKNLRDKWKSGQITPQRYWAYETLAYYSLNSLWWLGVLGAVSLAGGSFNHRLKLGLGIIGIGAVGAVIYKNIREDIKEQEAPNILQV